MAGKRAKDEDELLSRADRYRAGKALREGCPRDSHAKWKAPARRRGAVELVLAAEKGRVAHLLPLRHGRMARSAFTFYRGAALTMAEDLASTPASGVRVQCCGDAHLCNFGGFATPERKIIFSVNDLDETLPAPWEWDVKRLATSFVVACREIGLKEVFARDVVATCVRTYRESMERFSRMSTLELSYQAINLKELMALIPDRALRKRALKRFEKVKAKTIAEDVFPKLAEHKGEMPVITDQLPTIFHPKGYAPGEVEKIIRDALEGYRATLWSSHRSILERYKLRDAAVKVVGIGSVGTYCWVLLLTAGKGDPLFLQVKEARASVLAPYAGSTVFKNQGERVVDGYRLMQPASDIFLGWTRALKRDLFLRQLRDAKITPRVESWGGLEIEIYAVWCAEALALAHAQSVSCAAQLSGYMGKNEAFDQAIAAFAVAYADQNESDHAAFVRAIRKGRVKAYFEQDR